MSEPVVLDVEVKKVTGKALLVECDGEQHWIPISQVVLDETDVKFEEGAAGALAITEWIAKEKGLA